MMQMNFQEDDQVSKDSEEGSAVLEAPSTRRRLPRRAAAAAAACTIRVWTLLSFQYELV